MNGLGRVAKYISTCKYFCHILFALVLINSFFRRPDFANSLATDPEDYIACFKFQHSTINVIQRSTFNLELEVASKSTRSGYRLWTRDSAQSATNVKGFRVQCHPCLSNSTYSNDGKPTVGSQGQCGSKFELIHRVMGTLLQVHSVIILRDSTELKNTWTTPRSTSHTGRSSGFLESRL